MADVGCSDAAGTAGDINQGDAAFGIDAIVAVGFPLVGHQCGIAVRSNGDHVWQSTSLHCSQESAVGLIERDIAVVLLHRCLYRNCEGSAGYRHTVGGAEFVGIGDGGDRAGDICGHVQRRRQGRHARGTDIEDVDPARIRINHKHLARRGVIVHDFSGAFVELAGFIAAEEAQRDGAGRGVPPRRPGLTRVTVAAIVALAASEYQR